MRRVFSVLPALLLACGGSTSGPAEQPALPPAENDPAYAIHYVADWYLIGNELTPGQNELFIQVDAPDGTDTVDLWLSGQAGIRLKPQDGSFFQELDISALPAGEHELIFAADGAELGFAKLTIKRSHPLYVIVSTDWDDADNSELELTLQEELHDEHPELKLTHFVGPYTFTDPTVTANRRQELVAWLKGMESDYNDEIGLHIHPYCSFVESAGVECLHQPSTVYDVGDETGYTVMCSAYSEDDFTTLLNHADSLFEQNGLSKSTSFRAGGWTADLKVLKALERAGYVADTSANNWARMEEWEGDFNGVLYEWNKSNWSSITDTSQPYYPSETDILSPGSLRVLEVPDNGILVDYVSSAEMIEVLDANWDGGPLDQPIAYSIGYHPSNFNETYKKRMHLTMTHLDRFLASRSAGPVIYQTLTNMTKVWPEPQ